MSQKNPYEALEIKSTATQEEIHAAFRKAASKWHPDKNPGNQEEAVRRFQEIEEAYSFLSDKDQRARYDDLGDSFEDELQVHAVKLIMHMEMELLAAPPHIDHVEMIHKLLDQSIANQKASITSLKQKIRITENLAKRWKSKGKRNLFANMYARRIREMQDGISDSQKAIEISLAAKKVMDGYEFDTGDDAYRMMNIRLR